MPRLLVAAGLVAVLSAGAAGRQDARMQAAGPHAQAVQPPVAKASSPAAAPLQRSLLDQYCVTCHDDRLKTGGLTLAKIDVTDLQTNAEVLEKIIRKLRSGQMPPEGSRRPDAATLNEFVATIETALDRMAAAAPNPGRVASRRLNRAEYVNVIQDLLALNVNGAELLPGDLAGYGFDNNADVLAITPGLMARYLSAATKISRTVLASPANRPDMKVYKVPVRARQSARVSDEAPFATHGGVVVRHTFPLDGDYVFKLLLKRDPTVGTVIGIEEDEHQIEVRVDHALVKRFSIGGRFKGLDPATEVAVPENDVDGQQVHVYRLHADGDLEFRMPIKAGTRMVAAAFTDALPSALDSGLPDGRGRDRGRIGLDVLQISGPFNGNVPEDTPSRRRIFVCRPAGPQDGQPCARKILSTLARRAYRRPVVESDVQPLLDVYAEGRRERDFEAGIALALEALLSSPEFLIRVERDPAGAKPEIAHRVSDLELASRLSFFLWKSIPDDELIDVAARGTLKEPAVLAKQVRRMLEDRRGTRFMHDFVEQWLQVRNINGHEADPRLFPGFDPTLRDAMARETKLFFESQLREDRPIQDLLRANYTYLNEGLARHYGINNLYGSHFRRVTLTDERRFGLLGHASLLTVTSYADRTSVVLRGKWVLDNLLGAPPPPPPPNVPPLKENTPGARPAALRERMEQHRNNAICASCHNRMDPLGFALEHFDAVGRWRQTDGGAEINSQIVLSGRTLDNPEAFREALLNEGRDEFVRTVTEKLLTYALGRGVDYIDQPTVREIVRNLSQDGYRWSSLLMSIIRSAPFQMRQASGLEGAAPADAKISARRVPGE